jgi:2-keto-4-pentenoate hydratase
MSDPSPEFELCTTIDRFLERDPDLSVSDVLAALDEVSMALACKRSRTHWSRALAAGSPGFIAPWSMFRRHRWA